MRAEGPSCLWRLVGPFLWKLNPVELQDTREAWVGDILSAAKSGGFLSNRTAEVKDDAPPRNPFSVVVGGAAETFLGEPQR